MTSPSETSGATRDGKDEGVTAGALWIWLPPMILALAAAVVFFGRLDKDVFFLLNGLSRQTGDVLWALVTVTGDGLVASLILFPWIRKNPRLIWALLLSFLVFALVGQPLKHAIHTARPPHVLDPDSIHVIGPAWKHNAFPSGHAATVFSLAGVLALTTRRALVRILVLGAAALAAASRVVVGVHWPLDVLAGAAIGWAAAWISLELSSRMRWGWTGTGQKILGVLLLAACLILLFSNPTGYRIIQVEQRILAGLLLLVGGRELLGVFGVELFERMGVKRR